MLPRDKQAIIRIWTVELLNLIATGTDQFITSLRILKNARLHRSR